MWEEMTKEEKINFFLNEHVRTCEYVAQEIMKATKGDPDGEGNINVNFLTGDMLEDIAHGLRALLAGKPLEEVKLTFAYGSREEK